MLDRATANGLALDVLGGHWHESGDQATGRIVGHATPSDNAFPAALDALTHTLRTLGVVGR